MNFYVLKNAQQQVAVLGAKETPYGFVFQADIYKLLLETADER
jgi:hypothetical protein